MCNVHGLSLQDVRVQQENWSLLLFLSSLISFDKKTSNTKKNQSYSFSLKEKLLLYLSRDLSTLLKRESTIMLCTQKTELESPL